MNDWQKDLWSEVEKTTASVEQFFQEMNQSLESFANELGTALEELGEQVQDTVVAEVDRCVEDIRDFVAETNAELDLNFWSELDNLLNDSEIVDIVGQTATEQENPACIGCCHYHGYSYNGEMLVCAMHPHGVDGNHCQDWQES